MGISRLISGMASFLGYTVFSTYTDNAISILIATAAGGIWAMIVDTIIPEAFNQEREWTGLIASIGFLVAFAASKMD